MSVRIRLKRIGAKKRPFYRIVVADARRQRDGEALEEIGYYDPLTEPAKVQIDKERAEKWLKRGAELSDTVRQLFRKQGVV